MTARHAFTPDYRKGSGHRARCACGWEADAWDWSPASAQVRWGKHVGICPLGGGKEMHTWYDAGTTYWRCDCGEKGEAASPAAAVTAFDIHVMGRDAHARLNR